MFRWFCNHKYVLFDECDRYVKYQYITKGEHIYKFVCKKCEKTREFSLSWMEQELISIKDKHKKLEALDRKYPFTSKITINKLAVGNKTYEGSYVSEFIINLENSGYDCSCFNEVRKSNYEI